MPKITSKGQVTIPKRIRDYLGLKPGSEVDFGYGGDGMIVLKAAAGLDGEGRAVVPCCRTVLGLRFSIRASLRN